MSEEISAPTRTENNPDDRTGRQAVLASAVGYGVDGFDNLMIGFALVAITASLNLSSPEAGSLATVTLVGAVIGGFVFGPLADRKGRVKVLTWTITVFAVFTGLTALAQDYPQLVMFRFLAGLGLGGEFGVGMALAAEAVPATHRARATSWVGVGGQLGPFLGVLVAGPIVSAWGWRALFVIGAIPAIVAFLFRRRLHEPAKFVEHAASEPANGPRPSPLRMLVSDRRTTVTSMALVILCSVQVFGYYGIMTWMPTYLSRELGFSINKSGVWTAVTIVGMALGMIVFGALADRIGRRHTFWLFQLGAVISVLAYSQLTTPLALLLGGAVLGIFVNGMVGGYGALMAELYPTAGRATAQNVLFNIGRGIGGFSPIIFALVSDSHGFGTAIALLSVLYVLDMIVMFAIPERRGEELV